MKQTLTYMLLAIVAFVLSVTITQCEPINPQPAGANHVTINNQ